MAETNIKPNIDYDKLSFGLNNVAPFMFVATWDSECGWGEGELKPYGPLPLFPSAQVLNYGQAVFEGMKAYRSSKDRIVLFRPDRNAQRLSDGANRLCMQPFPQDRYVAAIKALVQANIDYVPPSDKGSLYMRPLLLGTGPTLGISPAPSYTFVVYAACVGAYFKGGQMTPIDILVEEQLHRAAPGGMGGTKAAGNYSPVIRAQLAAKKDGFSDVIYLDAKTDTYLEEVSSCNVFVVKGKTIKTPPLAGTILPGVTRDSVIQLARSRGYEVVEEPVSVHEAMEADEMFTTGTAVVLCSVGSLSYKGDRRQFAKDGKPTAVALDLYQALTGIQTEKIEDPFGWVVGLEV
nr:branched chain amino acid aminotransferase (BCAT) [Polytomella parva]|eukprot:CAMPEP_0175067936 /NCGR_PEP_ID=MMETSP0052_2-20121109/17387_1 /TAXON_ID=51329 ORGANISM="Polytomella parva, Strain SAG 63-3" /NCGR_SAMPLE_ID=MMETSP0052_2 /ASSEMBLY_ACC=CAM_ASM_000194 /LENGTH=347 /DNA_ID=CAMNT_0016334897 /DNA_START=96 /DNA_END=1139 /DNA_ORIENTATION=+